MTVISSREFRQNQKMYFELVDNNEQVIVQRGKNKAYKILPITQDDNLVTDSEFYRKIDNSLLQANSGNIRELTKEEQSKLLEI